MLAIYRAYGNYMTGFSSRWIWIKNTAKLIFCGVMFIPYEFHIVNLVRKSAFPRLFIQQCLIVNKTDWFETILSKTKTITPRKTKTMSTPCLFLQGSECHSCSFLLTICYMIRWSDQLIASPYSVIVTTGCGSGRISIFPVTGGSDPEKWTRGNSVIFISSAALNNLGRIGALGLNCWAFAACSYEIILLSLQCRHCRACGEWIADA